MLNVAVVIPVYNELNRFDLTNLDRLIQSKNIYKVKIYLVDDASIDGLFFKIKNYVKFNDLNVEIIEFKVNKGKAEALRQGFLHATQENFEILLMADADFSTPVSEVLNLADLLRTTSNEIILGSRKRTSNNKIHSVRSRFLAGRLFAIQVRLLFGIKIYDTQCGFKAFRNTLEFRESISYPFRDRWLFDLELMLRIRAQNQTKVHTWLEHPLTSWVEAPESKVTFKQKISAVISLYRLKFSNLSANN